MLERELLGVSGTACEWPEVSTMTTYVMLTRLSPDALTSPGAVEDLNRRVQERVAEACPEVRWLSNWAVSGPYDYLDVLEAPDGDTATKVSLLVRSLGHATTETWVATPWERFLAVSKGLEKVTGRGIAKSGAAAR
jgi:uncharacterized protein with GYD domain